MSTTTTVTAGAWRAWRRRRGRPWEQVGEAATEAEAWGLLVASLSGVSADGLVLPAHRSPDTPPAGARGARYRRGRSFLTPPVEEMIG